MIEMLVVLAIVAILALLAAPGFHDTFVRGQIQAALPLADIARAPIEAAWRGARSLPADNAAVGLPVPEKIVSNHVRAVRVENGAIHVVFGNRAHGAIRDRTLTLRPGIVPDAPVVPIAWVCGHAEPPEQMQARGENRTDVPVRLLPYDCRARGTN